MQSQQFSLGNLFGGLAQGATTFGTGFLDTILKDRQSKVYTGQLQEVTKQQAALEKVKNERYIWFAILGLASLGLGLAVYRFMIKG